MRLDQEAFARGMWPEGLVAALATLSVAWPLTRLLREDTWIMPAVSLVLLVAISGAIMRTLDVPPSLVALSQLLLGLGGITGLYLRETLWRGVLPTADTLEQVGGLLRQAGTVLQTYAAPAPTTEGVSFLVVAVLTLTAVSVDSMGVTGRAPASAGIPLAAAFLVSVSNTGRAMEPWYFAVVALLWLVMLAQQGDRVLAAWPSSNRQETIGGRDVTAGPRTHRGLARVLGVGTLVAAVAGSALLPHLPPTFFGDGLARNPDARSLNAEAGEVAFAESMDPAQDLRNQSQAPVLTYRADATSLEPLRVTATDTFDDGQWVAPERSAGGLLPPGAPLPPPSGLADSIETDDHQLQVVSNELQPPHLATPAPPVGLDLDGGATYRFDPTDSTVVLQGRAPRYTVEYLTVTGVLPADVGEAEADPGGFDNALLEVDPASQEAVAALNEQVVGEVSNDLEAAVLMQNHFRSGGRYTYSLELAPPAEADADDPIGGFLETRQGYCVQFATAMVMMARERGIPSRMAVGFLPGQVQSDGTRRVIASDAHTWPELWISGMGWTRFEPTPGIRAGTPPAYARSPQDPSTQTQQPPLQDEALTPVPEPQPEVEPTEPTWWDRLGDWWPTIARTLLVVLVLALLMTLMPLVGRRYREAGLRSAQNPAERIEGQWTLLTRTLEDLGVDEPPARSPRDMGRHYRKGTVLDSGGEEALGRVTATLERSRYASPSALSDSEAEQMGSDVRTVVDGVREASPWNIRANAALLPRSGLSGVRAWLGSLFRR